MSIRWNGHDAALAQGMAARLTALIDPLPYNYSVAFGFRSGAVQDALYAQGRTTPGPIVTNAKGGQSAHNYGLAIDVYPIINGQLDYGYSGGSPEPSSQSQGAWQALWDAVDSDPLLFSGRRFSTLYDPGHIERANWKLFIGQPIPAEATSAPVDGGTPPDGSYVDPNAGDGSTGQPGFASGAVVVALAVMGLLGVLLIKRGGF